MCVFLPPHTHRTFLSTPKNLTTNQDGKEFPWSLSYTPTEPLLAATRKVVPPLAGVDVSPIVWVALLSFFNEILLGPQGILNLIQRQAQL